MKVLYVFTSAATKSSSVQNKVLNQIIALNENKVSCNGLFFTTDDFDAESPNPYYQYVKVEKLEKQYFRSLKQRSLYHQTIVKYFEKHNPEFDFVYFRYDNASKYLAKLTKKYPGKVLFEHVTAEIPEIKIYQNENPLRLKLSSLLGNLEYMWLPIFREKLWGREVRKHAAFGVCNSAEIASYEKKQAGGKYLTFIGGDAVKTSDYTVRKALPVLKKEFRIIFLKGAQTAADFNGLDRVFSGIKNYKGDYDIKLYLHGRNLETEKRAIEKAGISNHVVLGNYLQKEEIAKAMEDIHIGLGAMGLHRKGISSTTTIKGREYFAMGIPFVFGHHDPDISESEAAKRYCLEFEANEVPIDFEKILNWYQALVLNDDIPGKMNAFALENLDYIVKMNKLENYLNCYLTP